MRIFRFLTFAGLLIFACGTTRASDISVYFNPANSTQNIGSNFTIDIMANIQSPGLVDFAFTLDWDKSMMQLNGISGGTGALWDFPFWDNSAPESITGFLKATDTSPTSVSGDNILLALLEFTCLKDGNSTLGIVNNSGLFFGPDTDGTGGPSLDWTVTEGSVTQENVVPEPCTIVLLSAGLTGLAYMRKRKRA